MRALSIFILLCLCLAIVPRADATGLMWSEPFHQPDDWWAYHVLGCFGLTLTTKLVISPLLGTVGVPVNITNGQSFLAVQGTGLLWELGDNWGTFDISDERKKFDGTDIGFNLVGGALGYILLKFAFPDNGKKITGNLSYSPATPQAVLDEWAVHQLNLQQSKNLLWELRLQQLLSRAESPNTPN